MMVFVTSAEWAAWVQGVGTLLAFCGALVFSLLQRRDADRTARESVRAWVECRVKKDGSPRWRLVTDNLTAAPVYRWLCRITWDDGAGEQKVGDQQVGILPPGLHKYKWRANTPQDGESNVSVELFFMDARGKARYRSTPMTLRRWGVWKRWENLAMIDPPRQPVIQGKISF